MFLSFFITLFTESYISSYFISASLQKKKVENISGVYLHLLCSSFTLQRENSLYHVTVEYFPVSSDSLDLSN